MSAGASDIATTQARFSERDPSIDALRGVTVFGILLANRQVLAGWRRTARPAAGS